MARQPARVGRRGGRERHGGARAPRRAHDPLVPAVAARPADPGLGRRDDPAARGRGGAPRRAAPHRRADLAPHRLDVGVLRAAPVGPRRSVHRPGDARGRAAARRRDRLPLPRQPDRAGLRLRERAERGRRVRAHEGDRARDGAVDGRDLPRVQGGLSRAPRDERHRHRVHEGVRGRRGRPRQRLRLRPLLPRRAPHEPNGPAPGPAHHLQRELHGRVGGDHREAGARAGDRGQQHRHGRGRPGPRPLRHHGEQLGGGRGRLLLVVQPRQLAGVPHSRGPRLEGAVAAQEPEDRRDDGPAHERQPGEGGRPALPRARRAPGRTRRGLDAEEPGPLRAPARVRRLLGHDDRARAAVRARQADARQGALPATGDRGARRTRRR